MELEREAPLIWHTNNSISSESCRNSVQGKNIIVDERGFVCSRFELLESGCCGESSEQFSCKTCNPQDCCAIYEYCVSCCLHPEKKSLLERVMEKASKRQKTVFASVRDSFELCLSKCRTDSHSVQNENRYRDPVIVINYINCIILLHSSNFRTRNTVTGRPKHMNRKRMSVRIRCFKT